MQDVLKDSHLGKLDCTLYSCRNYSAGVEAIRFLLDGQADADVKDHEAAVRRACGW